MGVNRCISGGACQVFAVSVWNVLASLRVTESLGQTEVDYVHVVLLFADADQEVVWLDVSMQKVSRVHEFNSLELQTKFKTEMFYHLVSQHQHSLEGELAFAVVEQVFQAGT